MISLVMSGRGPTARTSYTLALLDRQHLLCLTVQQTAGLEHVEHELSLLVAGTTLSPPAAAKSQHLLPRDVVKYGVRRRADESPDVCMVYMVSTNKRESIIKSALLREWIHRCSRASSTWAAWGQRLSIPQRDSMNWTGKRYITSEHAPGRARRPRTRLRVARLAETRPPP